MEVVDDSAEKMLSFELKYCERWGGLWVGPWVASRSIAGPAEGRWPSSRSSLGKRKLRSGEERCRGRQKVLKSGGMRRRAAVLTMKPRAGMQQAVRHEQRGGMDS